MADLTKDDAEHNDLRDEIELLGALNRYMRTGGVILGIVVALLGWHFSRTWGIWCLIGGVGLAVLLGLSMWAAGAVGAAAMRKYTGSQK